MPAAQPEQAHARKNSMRLAATAFATMVLMAAAGLASADETPEARGKYLVGIMGCNDCHTPGYFLGKPDQARYLGGSDVGFEIPGLGVFYGSNLTPDKETGLGGWTDEQIITAFTTGKRPDGRELAPAMPWRSFASLSADDSKAITAYLKSLPAISNKVLGPYGPADKPAGLVMKIVAPQ